MIKNNLYGKIYCTIPYNIENRVLSDEEREIIANEVYREISKSIFSIDINKLRNTSGNAEFRRKLFEMF